jgi:hypothetical protein
MAISATSRAKFEKPGLQYVRKDIGMGFSIQDGQETGELKNGCTNKSQSSNDGRLFASGRCWFLHLSRLLLHVSQPSQLSEIGFGLLLVNGERRVERRFPQRRRLEAQGSC